jgi:hypothetical protein
MYKKDGKNIDIAFSTARMGSTPRRSPSNISPRNIGETATERNCDNPIRSRGTTMLSTKLHDPSIEAAETYYRVARHHEARWKREERLRMAAQRREGRPHHREDRRSARLRKWGEDR